MTEYSPLFSEKFSLTANKNKGNIDHILEDRKTVCVSCKPTVAESPLLQFHVW